MKAPQAPTKAEREARDMKAARAPVTLDTAAAELADLAIGKDHLKAFAAGGRLTIYRRGSERLIARHELVRFREWVEQRIDDDPKWLLEATQRMRSRRDNVRRVVTGASVPLPRKVAMLTASVLPARAVAHAPPRRPSKVARLADAPRPAPPRVVERGRR